MGEWDCRAFRDEFGLNYTIIRPFNAYGINEAPREEIGYAHVIPDLIKKIISGQYPLELLGNGRQTRCFTHVSDIARGIIMAMESSRAINEDFNIGSENEVSMLNLAKLIWKYCGKKNRLEVKLMPGFKFDIKRRVPSSGKARRILGWEPQKQLKEELPKIIDWIETLSV